LNGLHLFLEQAKLFLTSPNDSGFGTCLLIHFWMNEDRRR
jgi:hypothetical protein